ncbi:MAG TPA: ASCH domain-containing protein [Mycobacteriales bacterium]|nr:ASCH domain-containing protein [Mycobacteriales bacterium]
MQQPATRDTIFGYDGDGGLGDRLVAAVLSGEKTATSSLAVQYLGGEPLPRVGEQRLLRDHRGHVHARLETTRVRIIPMDQVGDDVAHDEGEGFRDAEAWRRAHVRFWRAVAAQVRHDSGDPQWHLRHGEPVVVEWFRVVDAGPDGGP